MNLVDETSPSWAALSSLLLKMYIGVFLCYGVGFNSRWAPLSHMASLAVLDLKTVFTLVALSL